MTTKTKPKAKAKAKAKPTTGHTCTMTMGDSNFPRSYAKCGLPAVSVTRDLGINLYLCKLHDRHVSNRRRKMGRVIPSRLKVKP